LNRTRIWDAASNTIDNGDEGIYKANMLFEQLLVILGAAALEDKLQKGVLEAAEMLHWAEIKL